MKKGNILVDQVTKEGCLIESFDESLSPSEIYDKISMFFPNIHKASQDQRIILGEHKGHKFAIRCKNVTYLGNPHPHFKKRIQISDDLFSFYKMALSLNAEPILMGVYTCGDNTIFVDFKIDTYIDKKAHNSSAHIYVSDLVAATEDGYFQKIDYFGNTVTAIRPDIVNVYLDELFEIEEEQVVEPPKTEVIEKKSTVEIKEPSVDYVKSDIETKKPVIPFMELKTEVTEKKSTVEIKEPSVDYVKSDIETKKPVIPFMELTPKPDKRSKERMLTYAEEFRSKIVPRIKDFFENEDKEWHGIECYKKMIATDYKNKYQSEWVGFFLEYEFEKYLTDNKLHYLITYAQDKKNGGIDLDLFFPTIESYGDLKAHSEESRGIQGNDWDTIFGIINGQDEKSHVYYIVCEHSTEKDSLHDYEVTKFWNAAHHKSNLMSYSSKMKNNIRLKRVCFLDINFANREFLTKFKQGINSNGKPRAPKIMIEQDNIQHFIVEEMIL